MSYFWICPNCGERLSSGNEPQIGMLGSDGEEITQEDVDAFYDNWNAQVDEHECCSEEVNKNIGGKNW